MRRLIKAGSKEATLRRIIKGTIKDLGGEATARQLLEGHDGGYYWKYRRTNGLKALTRKLDAMVDDEELNCRCNMDFPMEDIYSIR